MVPDAAATPQVSHSRGRWSSKLTNATPMSGCTSVADYLTPQQLAACPHRFLCPISLDVMTDPVLLSHTGQTYDYPSLISWFESGEGVLCPPTLPRPCTPALTHAAVRTPR